MRRPRPKSKGKEALAAGAKETLAQGASDEEPLGPAGAPPAADDPILPEEIGKPTLPAAVPIPDVTPDQIPPPGPGEAPDTTDDTSNVPLNTLVWLMGCKAVLLAEGFKRDPLRQARKRDQVWGVVRQEPDHMQIHVRAFKDGRLESEHELSNRYVQHLWSHRWGAHVAVREILAKHGMPTHLVSDTFQPITGTKAGKKMPRGRTKTTHLIGAGLVVIGMWIGYRYVRRLVLRR